MRIRLANGRSSAQKLTFMRNAKIPLAAAALALLIAVPLQVLGLTGWTPTPFTVNPNNSLPTGHGQIEVIYANAADATARPTQWYLVDDSGESGPKAVGIAPLTKRAGDYGIRFVMKNPNQQPPNTAPPPKTFKIVAKQKTTIKVAFK
jgi:hypothetical protein